MTTNLTAPEGITLPRSLALPLYPASLMFVGISALLLALVASIGNAGLIRIFPAFFLLSWLFKYAYNLLEHVANGHAEPPVLSTDMLGPMEQRPFAQFAACLGLALLCFWIGGPPSMLIAAAGVLTLPAFVAVLGVNRSLLDALNPGALWRVALGLGPCYLLIIATIACYAAAVFLLARLPLWNVLRFAVAEFGLLSVYSLIGAALYVRRAQLGFEPTMSPEWMAEKEQREDQRQRELLLDELYKVVRVRSSQRAIDPLQRWLADRTTAQLGDDAPAIVARALQWDNKYGCRAVALCVIAELLQRDQGSLAVQLLAAAQARMPDIVPESEAATVALAARARVMGQRRMAAALLVTYQDQHSGRPLGAEATALQQELAS